MTQDSFAYPAHLGWAAAGEKLLFRRRLEDAGRWPPSLDQPRLRVDEAHRSHDDREVRPATPFLSIPESAADDGTSPRARWASNPSLVLLAEDGLLETAPREGVAYRLAAIVANAGAVPSLTTFVEFHVAAVDVDPGLAPIAQDAINPETFAADTALGVAALGVPAASRAWALSPGSWRYRPQDGRAFFAAVRTFDPFNDGQVPGWHSRKDRKVALRMLAPAVSGTWTGRLVRAPLIREPQDLGAVMLEVAPTAGVMERADGTFDPVLRADFHDLPNTEAHIWWQQMAALTTGGFALKGFYRRARDVLDQIEMEFSRQGDRLVGRVFADETYEATLDRRGGIAADLDLSLLRGTPTSAPPTASPGRSADLLAIKDALARL